MVITQQHAECLAREWVEAWNRHDVNGIMAHYAENILFTSPFVLILANEPTGTLQGTSALRAYFARGLAAYPELRFDLLDVLTGVRSVTLYYRSVHDKVAAETMSLNDDGLIARVECHYRDGDKQAADSKGAIHGA
ncbi:MAG TPA: nuclear transport factor 2 family protein [Nitrospiraceae bacterium]|nr:nuclear transport factor 2 family protein [Nitrospiraceae bacterium]